MDMKDKKLTIIGDVDPVHIVTELRKIVSVGLIKIVSVGPYKNDESKDPDKDDESKDPDKKEEPKKEEEPKEKEKEESKKPEGKKIQNRPVEILRSFRAYNAHMIQSLRYLLSFFPQVF
ncbi:hypothetical protein SLE2022_373160 [Rubroshorea leprosula]